MSNLNSWLAAALAASGVMAPVTAAAQRIEDTVAVVNGTPILLSEYQK